MSEIPVYTGTAGCLISKFKANSFTKYRQGAAWLPWQIKGSAPPSSDKQTCQVYRCPPSCFPASGSHEELYYSYFHPSSLVFIYQTKPHPHSSLLTTSNFQIQERWLKYPGEKFISATLFSFSHTSSSIRNFPVFLQWTKSYLQKPALYPSLKF